MELDELTREMAATVVAPQTARPLSWRWRDAVPKDRVTLSCGDCGRRITWWTAESRTGWLGYQDLTHRGWKRQGQGASPVSFRGELVDVSCPDCGWSRAGAARQVLPSWWLAAPEIL